MNPKKKDYGIEVCRRAMGSLEKYREKLQAMNREYAKQENLEALESGYSDKTTILDELTEETGNGDFTQNKYISFWVNEIQSRMFQIKPELFIGEGRIVIETTDSVKTHVVKYGKFNIEAQLNEGEENWIWSMEHPAWDWALASAPMYDHPDKAIQAAIAMACTTIRSSPQQYLSLDEDGEGNHVRQPEAME